MKKYFFTCGIWALLLCAAVLLFPGGEVQAAPLSGDAFDLLPLLAVGGFINIFDTRTMLEAVEQMNRPTNWLRDTFFPNARQFETETVDVDIIKGKRRLAPLVSPLAEGRAVERAGFSTNTLKPGYVKPKMATTAADLLKRQPGEVIYSGRQTIEQRAQGQLGKDLAELMDMVDRREEWMAAQALNLGKITMTIKGETGDKSVEVDFGMAATHKVTLTSTDLWSDTTNSTPLDDLSAWATLIRKDSGVNPTMVVMGTDALAAFLKHPSVEKKMDMRAVDMGEIAPRQLPDGVSYVGRMSLPGLFVDVYSYEAWYIDETSGNEVSMVPAKKVWMGSPRTANSKLHAVIQDVEAIEGGAAAAVTRFPKSWVTQDPSARWLMVQSAPLIAMLQPDAFVSATVMS